jgi:hypothetical protein
MEFLRRLRFIWAVLCLFVAAACALGFVGGAAPSTLFLGLAALFLGLTPYVHGGALRVLSIMWLGAGASIALAGGWLGGAPLIAQALAVVLGLYSCAFLGVWLIASLGRKVPE